MGIIEKIKEIEFEMARTQKNKATGLVHAFSLIAVILNLFISFINSLGYAFYDALVA
jgi:hypothetical protein